MTRFLWLLVWFGASCTKDNESGESAVDPSESAAMVETEDTAAESPSGHDNEDYRSAKWCAECHPTQYSEWEQSMHRYAAHSPVFDHMTARAVRDTAGGNGAFCTGCHTPLGTMDGEPGTTMAADRSDISLEGVTCVVCHQAVATEAPLGNTSLTLDLDGPMQGPFGSTVPAGHPSSKGEIIDTPELCGSCHDVFAFPALRIEEAYTEYVESPAAENGVRCQDCHMSTSPGIPTSRPVGKAAVMEGVDLPDRSLSSHRFIGPDYSLLDGFPYADPDRSAEATEELKGQIETLLEHAIHIQSVTFEPGPESSSLQVVLESLTPGHRVPTGFTSERQLWIHAQVWHEGEIVWESGELDTFGDLKDSLSWDVASGDAVEDHQLVNLQSKNLIRVGEVGISDPEVYETVFPFDANTINRRSLEPLEVRPHTYVLPGLPDGVSVTVALKYRNLPPYVLRELGLESLTDRLVTFTIDTVELVD